LYHTRAYSALTGLVIGRSVLAYTDLQMMFH
jgi:hypothetical protein